MPGRSHMLREATMKDQLIDAVVSRAGIDRGTAERAVDAVVDFLRENPQRLAELAGNAGIGDVGERLGKLFSR
ncbi:MAG: hypothetical protein M0R74_06455 [Dehalococcoidia bacterium]|nr:hypothetical protein [Dehalococcoidia bacterium]